MRSLLEEIAQVNEEGVVRQLSLDNWKLYRGDLKQEVIDRTVRSLRLSDCPVCESELKDEDNFGARMNRCSEMVEGYCPSCN